MRLRRCARAWSCLSELWGGAFDRISTPLGESWSFGREALLIPGRRPDGAWPNAARGVTVWRIDHVDSRGVHRDSTAGFPALAG